MSTVKTLSNEPATLTVEQVTALVKAKVAYDAAKKAYEALVKEYHVKDIEPSVKYEVKNVGHVLKTVAKRNNFDTTTFKVEEPEMYAKYIKEGTITTLLVVPETKALVELS